MRKQLLGAFTFVLLAFSTINQAAAAEPEVIGVLFYADWCGSCKVLDPAIQKARDKSDLDNDEVLFVRLDLTDATTRYQSELMAQALGIDGFYKENEGSTGFMVLVDADTKIVITRLTKQMDASEITKRVHGAIAQAKG